MESETKTTTKSQLDILKADKIKADKAYSDYLKLYKKENDIKGRTVIQEIVALHKKGKSNKEIIELGYNKGTVSTQIRLYTKGKRMSKTTVAQYLPAKTKKIN